MNRYVALLRGINVGAGPRVGMADLRRVVTDLGHEDVRTHLQSGNVVFGSRAGDAGALAKGLERAIAEEFGLTVPVLIRDAGELAAVVDGNPYPGQDDPTRLLVAFLAAAPAKAKAAALTVPGNENVEFIIAGREVYQHFPDGGYGRSKFTNVHLEKRLGVVATTRNWKTVRALSELATG
ncbi:DUF1697 domain-containing protein [Micromonospora sp. PLK6-60]|uniref:DUF1697 domain-containing protein n=1 Tax=Micromonospora sp. PLK6-60 TaxID=2873383 RepID=UPI001CA78271|nr:DUF1697 domain-containing protein [Micromonospora sp. PLK6-60]MBY8872371.1 DUF1697 domain-containing protein [Micromonospora sp. PLK6-60]